MSPEIMQLGIAFQTDKQLADYGPLAARAEECGFDVVSVYNDLFFQPAWLPLLEMARATKRVGIGPAAVNPFTCHPINIAGHVALIEEASRGRAFLGLARGAWLSRLGIRPERPVRALQEAFSTIRNLLEGGASAFQGDIFQLPPGPKLLWKLPDRRIPFLLGSWGRKTITACAGLIDEVKLGGTCNPETVARFRALLDNLGKGRHIRLVIGCVSVVDQDGTLARRLARRESALYLPVVAGLDPTLEVDPGLVESVEAAHGEGDAAQAGRLIPDGLLERIALAGTPLEVTEKVLRLREAGADRVDFGTPHGLLEESGLQLLAEVCRSVGS